MYWCSLNIIKIRFRCAVKIQSRFKLSAIDMTHVIRGPFHLYFSGDKRINTIITTKARPGVSAQQTLSPQMQPEPQQQQQQAAKQY